MDHDIPKGPRQTSPQPLPDRRFRLELLGPPSREALERALQLTDGYYVAGDLADWLGSVLRALAEQGVVSAHRRRVDRQLVTVIRLDRRNLAQALGVERVAS
jgi:hypothetical protein